MDKDETTKLVEAATKARDQLAFYAREHAAAGKVEKAATNEGFATMLTAALSLPAEPDAALKRLLLDVDMYLHDKCDDPVADELHTRLHDVSYALSLTAGREGVEEGVTQADREAFARLDDVEPGSPGWEMYASGRADNCVGVQAFRAHRTAATHPPVAEKVERAKAALTKIAAFVPREKGDGYLERAMNSEWKRAGEYAASIARAALAAISGTGEGSNVA